MIIFVMEMLIRKAVEVIKSHPAEKPLFLYLAYQAPHMNIQVLAMILIVNNFTISNYELF